MTEPIRACMHPRDYARIQRMQFEVLLAERILQEKKQALDILIEFMRERYGLAPADKVTDDLVIVRPVSGAEKE